ncbi:hypothetical protein Q31b_39540 [Novipirellula aureliae]|uniref:Secreted protein n=1 Tax=Novipirellula aureliae TaxID=2527966 RepID=A0A5C6DUY3_9BACT|nr:hypothetical protein [Novipirellula aureliae]TWU38876.1 hypothetical protein Q31b_39540 [Novipirellula aureliae]
MNRCQLTFLSMVLLLPLAGCGKDTGGQIATQDELVSYMEEHPELNTENEVEPPEDTGG